MMMINCEQWRTSMLLV
uniref:Uncharacterized protein n=1 Tax=Rhizophora mucronata TaxID=61149 RepID=A0A2P2MGL7_RHIMU